MLQRKPLAAEVNLLKSSPCRVLHRSKVTSSDPKYNYIHISDIPTQKFQKSLPKLGIPYVKKSIERYITALEPIIRNPEQYKKTADIANKFATDKYAEELQNELITFDKANKNTSYVTDAWFDMYLRSRLPLVLNYNPFMSWKDDPKPEYNKVPIRCTNMLISALRFRRALKDQVLRPEVFFMDPKSAFSDRWRRIIKMTPDFVAFYVSAFFQGYALDMSQFGNLFESTRIPRKGKDELKTYPDSKHIAFLKGGQFFVFDVLDANGDIKDADTILACVNYINSLKVDTKQDSITVLSAEDRDVWAIAREHIVNTSAENAKSLEMLDSAQFTIALDDLAFNADTEVLDAAHNYLHGNCKLQGDKPLNRWFDKSFGYMFDAAGHASITFEHSWGDGVAVLRAFNEIYEDSTRNHFVHPDTKPSGKVDPSQLVRHLPFKLDAGGKKFVNEATKSWKERTNKLDLNYVKYHKLSRNTFKSKKLSPDSMFQLAFQMAFYKVYGYTAATYESCSTSAFKKGRTEVVRAATMQTKRACEAFAMHKQYSLEELRGLLDDCSSKHMTLTKEAALGQGFDRHLFMLKRLAEKRGNVPDLFKDPSYAEANHYVLSTSTLFGEYFSGGGFAPVVDDGFGLGYGLVDGLLGMLCSSYKGGRNGTQMVQAFTQALDEIAHVLEHAKGSQKVLKENK